MSEVTVWLEWAAIVVLIGFSGLFSGLNLGLMSLDTVGLEIIMASDNQEHVNAAKKIKPLRDRGNWLLCTLLLGNVAVNAELSILLADKTSGTIGFIVSTVLIVIFGEIVPQALCSRYALEIGAKTVYIVWPLMIMMAVLAWPVSWILDQVLGEELGTIYSNKELSKLVDITARHRPDSMSNHTASMLKGALQLDDKLVADVYTQMKNVYWLSEDEVLDFELLTKVFKLGHSRIPIFRQVNEVNYCIGLLYVKDLILIDPDDKLPISKVLKTFDHHHTPIEVWKFDDLQSTLQLFITKRQHLAFVKDSRGEHGQAASAPDQAGLAGYSFVGIITLEDVIEEILKKELVDEYDNYVDPMDLRSTTPRLKEINWSNSLFKNHHMAAETMLNTKHNKTASGGKPVVYPQMIPIPVKIETEDKRNVEREVESQNTRCMIRRSESFKMLGLAELSDYDKKIRDADEDDQFQYMQINYKTVTVQIRCTKQTDVQTVNAIENGVVQRQIKLDGHKILDIREQ